VLIENPAQGLGPQAIAVQEAVGYERDRVGSEPLESRCEDGEGADTVAVVVAEDDDAASAPRGPNEELDGLRHAAHPERIVKRLDTGLEPRPGFILGRDPAGRENAREGVRDPQRPGEALRYVRGVRPKGA
jgi:hypothetical protein